MKEIQAQIRHACPICQGRFGGYMKPFGEESEEKLKEFKPNQIVNTRVSGTRKERSLRQLNTYWACCQTVADNTEDPGWNMKEKVDFVCRVQTHFVDPDLIFVRPDGTVQYGYRSIAFVNLAHIEACNYFDRAFAVMAKHLGISVDTLVEETQRNMKSY